MKALFELFRRFDARRIFGFIRRLGGMSRPKVKCYDLRSTHALRVEGDPALFRLPISFPNFYPRPPDGGRLFMCCANPDENGFLSTLSEWRATERGIIYAQHGRYFYPRPLGGGRPRRRTWLSAHCPFLSTPSGWRATAKTDKVFVCFCAKGRRICLFKTRKERICRWRFKKDKFWVLIWCEGSGKSVCALASHCG